MKEGTHSQHYFQQLINLKSLDIPNYMPNRLTFIAIEIDILHNSINIWYIHHGPSSLLLGGVVQLSSLLVQNQCLAVLEFSRWVGDNRVTQM